MPPEVGRGARRTPASQVAAQGKGWSIESPDRGRKRNEEERNNSILPAEIKHLSCLRALLVRVFTKNTVLHFLHLPVLVEVGT